MKITTGKKKWLCILFALVLVAGLITAPTVMRSDATGKEVEFAIDFKNVDSGNSWYFKVGDTSKFTSASNYYKGKITIDGTEAYVPFMVDNGGFTIWCNLFSNSDSNGKIPTSLVEIKKDTVLEEIYPGNPALSPDANSWAEPVENGQKLKVTNDLTVECVDGIWSKVLDEQQTTKVELSLNDVDGSNNWYFDLSDKEKLTASYYHANIKVDGKAIKVVFETCNNGLAIWNNFFDALQSDGNTSNPIYIPKQTLEIAAGTLFYEVDPGTTGLGTPVEGGQVLKVTKALSYTKKDDDWQTTESAEIDSVSIALDFKERTAAWYFTSADISKVTGKYYKGAVLIDGKQVEIPIEKQDNNQGFVIWDNCIGNITSEATVPTKKIEIQLGTVFYQIAPDKTGSWKDPVKGGQQFVVTNTLTVNKTNAGWTTNDEVQPTVITLGDGIGIYNKGTADEVFSIYLKGPDNLKNTNITFDGTITADGKKCQAVVFIPGNGEVFIYTSGAKKTIQISKTTDFISRDQKTIIRFDKNYEIDLEKQIYYEQGKKPTEKKALNVEISYKQLVGESFMFSWKMSGNKKPVASWYRTEAVIDGKTTKVLMEYTTQDESFFIYPNCFNELPVEGTAGYPVKNFKLKKGAKLTPVVVGTWADDVTGQPYTLTNHVDVTNNGTTWMDTDYKEKVEKIDPIEVKIVFKQIMNSAAVFEVITSDGKNIDASYGDWTHARGMILRGVQNDKTKKYTYASEYAAYSITGNTFYIDGLRLNELDGLQIDKNTVLYPDTICKSDTPIKITNQVRIVRDENDEWAVDTKFTTALPKTESTDKAEDTKSDDSSNSDAEQTETDTTTSIGAVLESEEGVKKNYQESNIVFAQDRSDSEQTSDMSYTVAKDSGSNMALWIVIAAAVVVLAGSGVIVVLLRKGRRHEKNN